MIAIDRNTHVETGIVSAVSRGDGRRIEIGLVGRDGFVGVPLALGVDRSLHESIVQIEGEALRLPSATFTDLLDQYPPIRTLLLRYAHVFQLQTAQTALSNGSYSLEERLARWILMCGDRIDGDEFPITHEFMAFMLGVRRPGVTTTVHILEGAGMIRTRRSHIEIIDRAKLEDAAGRDLAGLKPSTNASFGPVRLPDRNIGGVPSTTPAHRKLKPRRPHDDNRVPSNVSLAR